MSESAPHGARRDATAATALVATLAIQIFASLAATATSVLAPEIARDLNTPAKLIGVFVGILYSGGMAASLACGPFIERYGAIRVSQACALMCATGIALVAGAAGMAVGPLALIAAAAMVIGFGYGPITPASSQLLARTAPAARMSLVFSIKQTGVPGGAALAGAALPALALLLGWRWTFLGVAILGVVVIAVAERTRRLLDADRFPARPLTVAGVVAPLATVFASRGLIELSAVGFGYAATQVCLMSFLVIYFTETLGFPLLYAGYALTVANLGGIAGRIGWGAIADHFVAPRRLLGVLGLASACCAAATIAFTPAWPWLGLLAVCAVFGATAIGWNGVHLAEVARLAPPGQAGAITGACGFVTFAGVVAGPPLFALLAGLTDSYRTGFAVCGLGTGLLGLYLLDFRRK